jgi:hypothetical protein
MLNSRYGALADLGHTKKVQKRTRLPPNRRIPETSSAECRLIAQAFRRIEPKNEIKE